MKMKKGSRISSESCIYEVVAVVWSTVYLRRADGKDYDYTMDEVYESYRDIEYLKERTKKQYGITEER